MVLSRPAITKREYNSDSSLSALARDDHKACLMIITHSCTNKQLANRVNYADYITSESLTYTGNQDNFMDGFSLII